MLALSTPFIGQVLLAAASGLVVLLLRLVAITIVRRIQMRRGHLAGPWYATSPDPQGVSERLRCDRVHVHRLGPWLWGHLDRLEPASERPKRWRFHGRVSHNFIYGHFWTVDAISNPRSYGTFHLQMLDPGRWTGRYTSTVTTPQGPDGLYARLMNFPLEWSRRQPEESELRRRDLHLPPR